MDRLIDKIVPKQIKALPEKITVAKNNYQEKIEER